MKIIVVCDKCFALYRDVKIITCSICNSNHLSEFEIEEKNKGCRHKNNKQRS